MDIARGVGNGIFAVAHSVERRGVTAWAKSHDCPAQNYFRKAKRFCLPYTHAGRP
jgi:hypothetical protein